MTVPEYLAEVEGSRRETMAAMHGLILKTNPRVVPGVGKMMAKKMVIYKLGGFFTYGLASLKGHITLHAMPMYCTPTIRAKYTKLLP